MKKVLALIMAAVLCVPAGVQLGGGAKIAEASTGNLVVNGDFDSDSGEMDVTGWTPGAVTVEKELQDVLTVGDFSTSTVFSVMNQGPATAERDTTTSNTFLKVTTTATDSVMLQKLISNLESGKTYVVSYKIRIPEGVENIKVQSAAYFASTNSSEMGTIHTDTNGTWIPGRYVCTVPEEETTIRLRFFTEGYEGEAFHLDDVMVSYATEADMKELVNNVENAGFDSNLDGWWASAGDASWVDDGGNGVLKYTNAAVNNYLRYYVPVVGGQTYTFSYKFKGSNGSAARLLPLIVNRPENKTGQVEGSTDAAYGNMDPRQPGTSWKTATATFTAAEGAAYAEFRLRVTNGVDTIYLDDFVFAHEELVYSDGVCLNGSDYEMKLSDGNSATYADAALTADAYYDYSFEVAKDESLTKAGLLVGSEILTKTAGTFKYTAGAIGFATEGAGVAYFDNLSLTAHIHEGGEATCEKKAVCEKCLYEYGELVPHKDENHDELCDVCSADLHVHELAPTWYQEDGKHFQKCVKETCDYTSEPESCSGGTATCKKEAVCTTCGNAYGTKNAANHAHGSLKVTSVQAKLYGDFDDVRVTWKAASGATGYRVYYKKTTAKSYTYAGYTTKTSFVKKNLSDGVNYTFAVRAENTAEKVTCYDSYRTASAVYTLKKVNAPKIAKSSSTKVKVSWTNIQGESGYQISQSTSKSKTKIVSTFNTTSGKSKTIKAAKKKTCYYKVRAYKTVDGKKIYGPWSSVKSFKLK